MKAAVKPKPTAPVRLRQPSAAVREAFVARFGPKPGEQVRDLMGTLLRLRGKA
jgi:hypothetical protein